jgi:hypothetical protein
LRPALDNIAAAMTRGAAIYISATILDDVHGAAACLMRRRKLHSKRLRAGGAAATTEPDPTSYGDSER